MTDETKRTTELFCQAAGCHCLATYAYSQLAGVCDYHAAAQSGEDWGDITSRMKLPKYVALRQWFRGIDAIHDDPKGWADKGWDLELASKHLMIAAEKAGMPKAIWDRRTQVNKLGEEVLEPVKVQKYRIHQALISKIASEAAYTRTGKALNVRPADAQRHIDQVLSVLAEGMRI